MAIFFEAACSPLLSAAWYSKSTWQIPLCRHPGVTRLLSSRLSLDCHQSSTVYLSLSRVSTSNLPQARTSDQTKRRWSRRKIRCLLSPTARSNQYHHARLDIHVSTDHRMFQLAFSPPATQQQSLSHPRESNHLEHTETQNPEHGVSQNSRCHLCSLTRRPRRQLIRLLSVRNLLGVTSICHPAESTSIHLRQPPMRLTSTICRQSRVLVGDSHTLRLMPLVPPTRTSRLRRLRHNNRILIVQLALLLHFNTMESPIPTYHLRVTTPTPYHHSKRQPHHIRPHVAAQRQSTLPRHARKDAARKR